MVTAKRSFEKKATTYDEQVAKIKQRGMNITDLPNAKFYLQHLNYYRLIAYWLPFETDRTTHALKPGTCFDDVLNLYMFDRELRLLVLDAIERVEVSVRSQWAYQVAHIHGPHGHLNENLAFRNDRWHKNLDQLKDEVKRSDEDFIKHLNTNYSEELPPVWAVCEVMSLGLLSRWYNNHKPMHTRSAISAVYSLDEKVLESWLRHLCLVRNICAHHSRLWNREFTITPTLPRSKPVELNSQCTKGSRKLYNTLVILLYLMAKISPKHRWRGDVKALIVKHAIPVAAMGFPVDWSQSSIWQGHP